MHYIYTHIYIHIFLYVCTEYIERKGHLSLPRAGDIAPRGPPWLPLCGLNTAGPLRAQAVLSYMLSAKPMLHAG